MADPVLKLEGVVSGYGDTTVLHGIDLTVGQGERVAIIGRNGVGKTTLLSTVMGLTRLHAGRVMSAGVDVSTLAPHKRVGAGLGLVPQTRDIFPSLTVEENLLAGLRGDARIDEAYEMFPRLAERRSNGGAHLSGGEQQRVGIARAVVNKPALLLADEPTGNLDPQLSADIMGLFEDFNRIGTTVMIASHDLALIARLRHRILRLQDGRLVADEGAA